MVICDPNTVTRIVVRFPTAEELGFDPDAAFTTDLVQDLGGPEREHAEPAAHHDHPAAHTLQGYVWHCHILDHEDHDMMLKYRTVT